MQMILNIYTRNVGVDPDEDGGLSLSELITTVAEQVAEGYREREIRDANGNRVGSWTITP